MDSNCAIRPALGVEVAARLGDLSICWTWVVVASHLLIHQPRGLSTAARQKPGSSTARNPSEDYPNCQFFFAPPQPRLFVRPSPLQPAPLALPAPFYLIPACQRRTGVVGYLQRSTRQGADVWEFPQLPKIRQAAVVAFHAYTSSSRPLAT